MSFEQRPSLAVTLSIIAGAFIIVGGGMLFMMLSYCGSDYGMMNGFGGMMGGYSHMMGDVGFPFSLMNVMVVGLVSGVIVLTGAIMLNANPSQHTAWGTIILVFSIVSFLGMGGLFIGGILGIIGGAFALAWSPKPKT